MPYYKIDSMQGMAIVKAERIEKAIADAKAENGSRNIKSVTPATKEDIAWFGAMGGYIYEV